MKEMRIRGGRQVAPEDKVGTHASDSITHDLIVAKDDAKDRHDNDLESGEARVHSVDIGWKPKERAAPRLGAATQHIVTLL